MKQSLSLLVFTILLVATHAFAETEVTGRYLAGGGSDVQILLTIQSPPPAAFIVLQQIPSDVKVLSATPAPAGLQQEGGTIKWLFKRPQPGSIILTLQLSKQVPDNLLMGEVSYSHPRSRAIIKHKISN